MEWLKNSMKTALISLGKITSSKVVNGMNAATNYVALGAWFHENHFEIPQIVAHRGMVYDLIAPTVENEPVLYMEFGVWKGEATKHWAKLLKHPQTIIHGFDSFEGLPEAWNHATGKSHFSTEGQIPQIDDKRVKFFKGWFDQVLKTYTVPTHSRLILNMDADLYSSTKTVLDFMKPHIKPGTFIYFDEFNDRLHEMKAFDEFIRETGLKFRVIGANPILSNVMFECVAHS